MTSNKWILLGLQRLAFFISKYYFRAEVRGLENIPADACLFVGNHNCGVLVNPESWILFANHTNKTKHSKPLKALGHDLTFKIPIVSYIARSLGLVPAKIENAKALLTAGHNVVVYPGAGWESCRPSKDRDKIDFKGRHGFIKLARDAGVAIVPVVAAGAHDGWFIFTRGNRIAKFLKLDKLFRIDVFPIGFAFPFGLVIGPLFPFFPLPRKIILQILPPIDISIGEDLVLARQVVNDMQGKLNLMVQELPRSLG